MREARPRRIGYHAIAACKSPRVDSTYSLLPVRVLGSATRARGLTAGQRRSPPVHGWEEARKLRPATHRRWQGRLPNAGTEYINRPSACEETMEVKRTVPVKLDVPEER
ncbi:MAG: hypothetical protein ABEI86_08330, partial [Halobacteriaceae archaeon]